MASLSFVAKMLVNPAQRAVFKQIFAVMDAEGTGKLTADELYEGFRLYNEILIEEGVEDDLN